MINRLMISFALCLSISFSVQSSEVPAGIAGHVSHTFSSFVSATASTLSTVIKGSVSFATGVFAAAPLGSLSLIVAAYGFYKVFRMSDDVAATRAAVEQLAKDQEIAFKNLDVKVDEIKQDISDVEGTLIKKAEAIQLQIATFQDQEELHYNTVAGSCASLLLKVNAQEKKIEDGFEQLSEGQAAIKLSAEDAVAGIAAANKALAGQKQNLDAMNVTLNDAKGVIAEVKEKLKIQSTNVESIRDTVVKLKKRQVKNRTTIEGVDKKLDDQKTAQQKTNDSVSALTEKTENQHTAVQKYLKILNIDIADIKQTTTQTNKIAVDLSREVKEDIKKQNEILQNVQLSTDKSSLDVCWLKQRFDNKDKANELTKEMGELSVPAFSDDKLSVPLQERSSGNLLARLKAIKSSPSSVQKQQALVIQPGEPSSTGMNFMNGSTGQSAEISLSQVRGVVYDTCTAALRDFLLSQTQESQTIMAKLSAVIQNIDSYRSQMYQEINAYRREMYEEIRVYAQRAEHNIKLCQRRLLYAEKNNLANQAMNLYQAHQLLQLTQQVYTDQFAGSIMSGKNPQMALLFAGAYNTISRIPKALDYRPGPFTLPQNNNDKNSNVVFWG